MNSASLLPPNATATERAVEQATAHTTNLPVPLRSILDADTCPANLLPWLAWSWGVDGWDDGWSEKAKRNTIRNAYRVQSRKGSAQSIRSILVDAGYGDSVVIEGLDAKQYDGAITYNGDYFHGQFDQEWAMYRVYLKRPLTIEQATKVRNLLAATAPARCKLEGLNYTQALNLYDGLIRYDGTYTHGVA